MRTQNDTFLEPSAPTSLLKKPALDLFFLRKFPDLVPYPIPGTSVLKNLIGLNTGESLAAAEADLVNARIIQLMDHGNSDLPTSRDFKELSAIHFHLFQDLYSWAGSLRSIDFKRGSGQFFAPQAGRRTNLEQLTSQLAEKNFLKCFDRQQFVEELTYFYDLLNWIHPFREGNGRTQRHFWSRISADAGWILDWRPIQSELHEASRRAREDNSSEMLHTVLNQVVAKFPTI